MMKQQQQNGFTLVEILVVASIIGLLAILTAISLNTSRIKTRDAVRQADIAELKSALIMYYDLNSSYPKCGFSGWASADLNRGAIFVDNVYVDCYINLKNQLVDSAPTLLPSMPIDPKNFNNKYETNSMYAYRYISNLDGSEYALVYTLESGGEQVVLGY